MAKVLESSESLVLGSQVSEREYFSFGKAKHEASHPKADAKFVEKVEKGDDFKRLLDAKDYKFMFGEVEADSFSAKGDILSISDYVYAQHDGLLSVAQLQSKCLAC